MWLLGATSVSFLLFLVLVAILQQPGLEKIDRSIMQSVYALRTPAWTTLMELITFFGDQGLIIILITFAFVLSIKKHWQQAAWLLLLAGSGGALNAVLKVLIARPRPSLVPLLHEIDFSFPSGHAMDSLIVYGAIVYLLLQLFPKSLHRPLLVACAAVIVGAIGFSRIYLGVHYPSDVLGGYLLGTGWLLLGITLAPRIERLLPTRRIL